MLNEAVAVFFILVQIQRHVPVAGGDNEGPGDVACCRTVFIGR